MVGVSFLLAAAALAILGTAHPGEHHDHELIRRQMEMRVAMAENQAREASECEGSFDVIARRERAVARRAATLRRLRIERGIDPDLPILHRRTLQQFNQHATKQHDHTKENKYTLNSTVTDLFGANVSCILTPDNANGPYFVQGEMIRSNVVENLKGVPVHLEIQFVDTTTCKPATSLLVDIWSCDPAGKYSGVAAAGQGGLQTTYLRGVQPTDKDGVVEFDTLFPGHYSGRATHEHVITHTGATILANGSYTGGRISHLSQIFYDQPLIDAVEKLAPYSSNTIAKTSNTADGFTGYSATAAYDPFPEYVYLGTSLQQGLFTWIEMGINPNSDYTQYAPAASYWGPNGGSNNPNFNMGIVGTPPPTHG